MVFTGTIFDVELELKQINKCSYQSEIQFINIVAGENRLFRY